MSPTPRSSPPRPPPALDDEIVADEGALMLRVDELLHHDPRARRMTREVIRHQDRLQIVCDEAAWKRYLDLEQIANERAGYVLVMVARWAFAEGQRRR